MSMVVVDFGSNPHGQHAEAHCRECGSVQGLVPTVDGFVCRDGCPPEAERCDCGCTVRPAEGR